MPRLIEVDTASVGVTPLVVQVGDVLAFAASGVRVGAGSPVLEQIGPLFAAVVGLDGRVISPEGPPSTVLFVARAPGRVRLEVMTGDPWQAPRRASLLVDVQD